MSYLIEYGILKNFVVRRVVLQFFCFVISFFLHFLLLSWIFIFGVSKDRAFFVPSLKNSIPITIEYKKIFKEKESVAENKNISNIEDKNQEKITISRLENNENTKTNNINNADILENNADNIKESENQNKYKISAPEQKKDVSELQKEIKQEKIQEAKKEIDDKKSSFKEPRNEISKNSFVVTDDYGSDNTSSINKYTMQLSAWIANHLPDINDVLYNNDSDGIVSITIDRNGRIVKSDIFVSTGYALIDNMLIETIMKYGPLPSVPEDYMSQKNVLDFLVPIYLSVN